MDISFRTNNGRFNYRVCGILLRDGCLLVMRDEVSPYDYLPGGRVKLHETAEDAILRELQEELHIRVRIERPLWLCQGFFTDAANGDRYHEICIYYLIDIRDTALVQSPAAFSIPDSGHIHDFEWIPLEKLHRQNLVPEWMKQRILHLPDTLQILVDHQ